MLHDDVNEYFLLMSRESLGVASTYLAARREPLARLSSVLETWTCLLPYLFLASDKDYVSVDHDIKNSFKKMILKRSIPERFH